MRFSAVAAAIFVPLPRIIAIILGREKKTPTPKISAFLRKRPVLLRANFVLTKDRKRPYYGHFCGKIHREGSCSKAAGVLSKVQMLNLVLGVGVFSLLPIFQPQDARFPCDQESLANDDLLCD